MGCDVDYKEGFRTQMARVCMEIQSGLQARGYVHLCSLLRKPLTTFLHTLAESWVVSTICIMMTHININ